MVAITRRTAERTVTRCFKFLRFCCEDEGELTFDAVDFSLCSPKLLFKSFDYLQDVCKLGHGGHLGYVDAVSKMIAFGKLAWRIRGTLSKVLCNRTVPQSSAKDGYKDDEIAVDIRLDIQILEKRDYWQQ